MLLQMAMIDRILVMKKIFVILLGLVACFSVLMLVVVQPKPASHDDLLTLTGKYPHNTKAFTQGLFFHKGELYETAGLYGHSKVYKNIKLSTGESTQQRDFAEDIFAEGATIFKGKLYVLTWREQQVLILNPDNLEIEKTLTYPREGWGLTTDGEFLIASDGTATLYFMNEELKDVRQLTVRLDGAEIDGLNELEYINGDIWANIYLTDDIVVIDSTTGEVKEKLDFAGLYENRQTSEQVLNGIAYDGKKVYLTGKNWDTLFEFEIITE